MLKSDKELILNEIHNYSAEVERLLPNLRKHCEWGLQKGKPGNLSWFALKLHQLADALGEYNEDYFDLDDLQDYNG